MAATNKVYKGHNSPFLITILDLEGNKYSSEKMETIERAYLKYIPATGESAEYADSAVEAHEDVFDWDTFASSGKIIVDIGLLDFTAGRDITAELIIYDEDYPEGRVLPQLDILISEEAEGDIQGADVLSIISGTPQKSPITKIASYIVLVSDLNGCIRYNSALNGTFTLPSVGASEDGSFLDVVILGTGDLTLLASDSDTITNETHTQITGTTRYSSARIEYVHAITAWVFKNGTGSWGGA